MHLIAKESFALIWALGLVLGTSAYAVDVRTGKPSLTRHQPTSSNPYYVSGKRYPTFGRPQPVLRKRQEESADDVTSQNTERLRKCKEPRPVYEDQDNVDWYEVDFDKNQLVSTKTTKRGENKIGKPNDSKQGKRFVVDHIFELQIITYAFDAANKGNDKAKEIPDAAWKRAHDIVNGLDNEEDNCAKIADKITVVSNLRGIAERINLLKETIYDRVTSGDKDAALDPKWKNYLPAVKDYLSTTTNDVDTNIQAIGDELSSLTGETKVGDYFVDFGKGKWKAGQDYLDGQTEEVMAASPCTLTDECQMDVPTIDQPSLEGINPACKCTCDGADTPLTDAKCIGYQGESQTQCNKDDPMEPVEALQKINDKLEERGDDEQCCGPDDGTCVNVEVEGDTAVNLCGKGCVGCARLANYLQGFIDHCQVDGKVSAVQDINETPGLRIEV